MKLITIIIVSATCAWGQDFTNEIGHHFTVTTNVVTNIIHPKQYWGNTYGCLVYGCKEDHGRWFDGDGGWMSPWGGSVKTRDNPDLRIIEVREIVTATLQWKGADRTLELENNLLRKWEENRVQEPPVKPAERWVPGPVQTNFPEAQTSYSSFFSEGNAVIVCTNATGSISIEMKNVKGQ